MFGRGYARDLVACWSRAGGRRGGGRLDGGQADRAVELLCRKLLAAAHAEDLGQRQQASHRRGGHQETKVVNANNSAPEQAAQIENLILEGWDAIVINAASPTALNGTIEEACAADIVVVVFDGIATAPCAYKVSFDFQGMGKIMTEFVADHLGGKGNILEVRGIAGVSVDEDIAKGVAETLKSHPDIKVLASVYGNFTPTVTQKEVAAILPSLQNVDAVISQGGGYGAYQAFKAAGREIPPIIFGNYQEELQAWQDLKKENPDYRTMSLSSAPGVASIAFWVAQQVLAGKDVPKDLRVPLLVITDENLEAWAKATAEGEVATPVYDRDWTVKMIDANAAGTEMPPAPAPGT
jgi:ribose transport system substrate-binding protein